MRGGDRFSVLPLAQRLKVVWEVRAGRTCGMGAVGDDSVEPVRRELLKAWIRAVLNHSWSLPSDKAVSFIDDQFALLEQDFGVELSWNEIRTVEISFPDSSKETEIVAPGSLKLVK